MARSRARLDGSGPCASSRSKCVVPFRQPGTSKTQETSRGLDEMFREFAWGSLESHTMRSPALAGTSTISELSTELPNCSRASARLAPPTGFDRDGARNETLRLYNGVSECDDSLESAERRDRAVVSRIWLRLSCGARPLANAELLRTHLAPRGRRPRSVHLRRVITPQRLICRGSDCLGEERGHAPLQAQGGWRSANVLLRVYARWLPQEAGLGTPSATLLPPYAIRATTTGKPNAG
jgi:hypothetical protein